jgi:hypothetical protein
MSNLRDFRPKLTTCERCGSCWERESRSIVWYDDLLIKVRTTFVSAIFATLNSLSLQESVARWISDYMTSETGFTVMRVFMC